MTTVTLNNRSYKLCKQKVVILHFTLSITSQTKPIINLHAPSLSRDRSICHRFVQEIFLVVILHQISISIKCTNYYYIVCDILIALCTHVLHTQCTNPFSLCLQVLYHFPRSFVTETVRSNNHSAETGHCLYNQKHSSGSGEASDVSGRHSCSKTPSGTDHICILVETRVSLISVREELAHL